ncbi:MAG: transglycosylase SLT domain-containing protein [Alphaproteobacteria bacterium]
MIIRCNPFGFMRNALYRAVFATMMAVNSAAFAAGNIAMAPPPGDAGLCLTAIRVAESSRDFPKHLLHAIALTESGLWRQQSRSQVPWPWTVTVNGDGHYFDSPHHAADYIRGLLRDGVTNIDVGCMQINLRYHGLAFDTIEEALSPVNNVAYAVSFLEDLRHRNGTWGKAVRHYHSGNWRRGSLYKAKVQEIWTVLLQTEATIRAARQTADPYPSEQQQQPETPVVAAAEVADAKIYNHLKLASWPPRSYNAQKRAETAAWTHAMKPTPGTIKP